jgi:hypothetical protein
MGNKGAFITMGSDLKPNFTTYDAVVSVLRMIIPVKYNWELGGGGGGGGGGYRTNVLPLHPSQNIRLY